MARPASSTGAPELAHQPAPKAAKPRSKQPDAKRAVSSGKKAVNRLEGHASTLLVGAGVGAALTLSLVALRAKQPQPAFTLFNKKSTLASVLVKTAVFAIARASTRGSITNLFARAVGNSLA
jgi:hypothetical protein